MKTRKSNTFMLHVKALPLILLSFNSYVYAVENVEQPTYRATHDTVCYRIQTHQITCGDFSTLNAFMSGQYHDGQGADVMASFSSETHPGDYPFLNQLAKKLGYLGKGLNPNLELLIQNWSTLDEKAQSIIIKMLSEKVSAPNPNFSFPPHFRQCLNYWSSPKAQYDQRLEQVKIAEVSALCVAESGILPKVK